MEMLILDRNKLKVLMAEGEFTQRLLASRAGLTEWELSRVMRGHSVLTAKIADAIAKVLKCKVEQFAKTATSDA